MKSAKVSTIVLTVLLLLSISITAQQNSSNDLVQKGRTLAKEAYMQHSQDKMVEARSVLEKAISADRSNPLPLYYITLVDYKLLEMSMRGMPDSLFDKYFNRASSEADSLSVYKDFKADAKTISAAIIMMKLAINPMSGVTLAPKIYSLLDEAQSIDPDKPYSYVIRGMMAFNTPKMFGGSDQDALKDFNQALKLFEANKDKNIIEPDWGYAETLAWLGRTLENLDNNDAAMFTYKKALTVEPDYGWVSHVLLPQLEKKIEKK